MKKQILAGTVCVLALTVVSAAADSSSIPSVPEKGHELEMPSFDVGAFYRSMKVERGLVENKESIFGYELEIEWYHILGGLESCYDLTNINRRRGRYNEIESFLGLCLPLGDFSSKIAYAYRACGGDEPDTQLAELELEYETSVVTPFFEGECDTHDVAGALYGCFGVKREWKIADCLLTTPYLGIGAGNAKRNRADFDTDRTTFREMCVGVEFEIELAPHLKLVPGVELYDQFTSNARHTYHKGFAAIGSCCLSLSF